MTLYNTKFVWMLPTAGTTVNGTVFDAIVHVRVVDRAGSVKLCAVEIDVLFYGDAEGHAGRSKAAFARHRLFRR